MGAVTPFLFMGLIFVAFLIYAYYRTKENARKWSLVADRLGLNHVRGSSWEVGNIIGTLEGFQVQVSTFTRGSGKNRRTYTRVETTIRPALCAGLQIYRETPIFSSLGKFLGGQDIQVGDKRFDDRFIIKASDERAALQLLSGDARERLLSYDKSIGALNLESARLELTESGVVSDPQRLEEILKAQVSLVASLVRQNQSSFLGH